MSKASLLYRYFHASVVATVSLAIPVSGQAPDPTARELGEKLRATGRVFEETGSGSEAIYRGSDERTYVLNKRDNCIWVFDRDGLLADKVVPRGTDLKNARSLAVDPNGTYVVAGGATIKMLAADGTLLREFGMEGLWQTKDGETRSIPVPKKGAVLSVNVLRDGRILASGMTKEGLIVVFDHTGNRLFSIGERVTGSEDKGLSEILSLGEVVLDKDENIYFLSSYAIPPKISKYSIHGTELGQWSPDTYMLRRLSRMAEDSLQNPPADKSHRVIMMFSSAAPDKTSEVLWFLSGSQLVAMDRNGNVRGKYRLYDDAGQTLAAMRLVLAGDSLLVLSQFSGVWEFPKPKFQP